MLNIDEGEILLVNKPYRWTSFDVIGSLRGLIKHLIGKKIKIGHAGTLDPLATGLLIVCIGKATKRIEEFKDFDKEYTGTFTLGATTPSYDMEKEVDETYPTGHITPEMIHAAARSLSGDILQVPPMFSAIKIDGKRAYESARKDKDLGLAARPVSVPEFEITRISHACALLSSRPDKSISDISAESGFNSSTHFNRMFLVKKGCTPGYFRQQYCR